MDSPIWYFLVRDAESCSHTLGTKTIGRVLLRLRSDKSTIDFFKKSVFLH